MKILLIGGGSGGHITPLLAVARELKTLHPHIELHGVCERGSKFAHLYEDSSLIQDVHQIPAGKYRRYAGLSLLQRVTDMKTVVLNGRDVFRTVRGYRQALKLLKKARPDGLIIKGGFVAVPVGLAAAKLKIPFITHDSDSTPGLANKIISRWATVHATGMPTELYSYPPQKTVYTGIPVSPKFVPVDNVLRQTYRKKLGMSECSHVLTVVGGSQGGAQLNTDVVAVVGRLMERFPGLGVIHIAGATHEDDIRSSYKEKLQDKAQQVRVLGFVDNVFECQGAADVVIARAGATMIAELAVQGMAMIVVPGRLAGGHQDKNAQYFVSKQAALTASHGDAEGLYDAVLRLLEDTELAKTLGMNLQTLGKPSAARELAQLSIKTFAHAS